MTKVSDRTLSQLDEKKLKYQLIPLPKDIDLDIASHMRFHGRSMKHALATMIYHTEKGIIALQRRGDTRVSSKKIRQNLKITRLRLVTEDELRSLGYNPGLIPIAGFTIPVYLDQKVLEMNEIYGGIGDNLYGIKINPVELQQTLNYNLGDFTEYESQFVEKPRILSGITPSDSALHIGNYYGAVKPQIDLQETHETYYFVADLHALTTVKTPDQLEKNVLGVVLDYLALGLDPQKCVFFRQSDVPEHSQLAVVLANYISYGQMKRMHAYKDKLQSGVSEETINMGLFNYPILMAADILLYKPYGVPVGEDQRQHIELARDIADAFNKTYRKQLFPLPLPLISENVGRIIGTDGTRKMSKSLGNIIGIFDDEKIIEKQIMGSFTDPNRLKATDKGKIEGNPIFIYHDLINDNRDEVEDLKHRYTSGTVGDVEVKRKLIKAHQRTFGQAILRRKQLANDLNLVREIVREGAKKAQNIASQTIAEVYQLIGENNILNITK